MRTTLTLDTDVAIQLDALRRKEGLSLKDAVNGALRRGLRAMGEPGSARPRIETQVANLGPSRIPLDNIAEALAAAEGEDFR